MKIVSKAPTEKSQRMLASLQKSVTKTLERKRRLGHYAVLWKDGKIVPEGEDAPLQPTTNPNAISSNDA